MNAINTSQSTRALANSTMAYTVCFAVWTIFSVIGLQIRQDLHLSETQLADVLAVHRHFRFVHWLFGGFADADKNPVPDDEPDPSCIVMTWWYYSRKGAEMPC